MIKPTEPVPRSDPGLRIPGRYKSADEDFVVEELPLYEPTGEGEHLYLWIEKRGLSTFDAVAGLARAFGKRDRDFGYAGMKDARAVTCQWVSIAGVDEAVVAALDVPGVTVLTARRHRNKLKLGHLRGNRFTIAIRGARAEHLASAQAVLADLERRGVPNYFGEQRFGKRGANLDKGLRILEGNPRKAARTMPRRLLGLVVSAVQSEIFNRVLIERRSQLDRLLPGDVAWIHQNGACFAVEDPAGEQPRCDAFEISPSGPLPGPKVLWAQDEAGAIETAVLETAGLDPQVFGRMPYGTHEGARRPLRVPVGTPTVAELPDGGGLQIAFDLPKGAYATAVLRELLVETPWFG